MRRTLVVMVKVPRPGRVKTRLARDIGPVAAAWWVRRQTARLLRRLDDPRWDLVLAVAPDHEAMSFRRWPSHIPRVAQGPGDLGQRMARVFRRMPPGPVVIVGADIPALGPAHVARAFRALGRAEAVVGPAPDGGYWAIGLRRGRAAPTGLFRGVRWSSAKARADTLVTLAPLSVAEVDVLADVDTVADLRATAGR